MSFFLGIDGGGSKIECVLVDDAGAVLARALGEGANLGRVSRDDLRGNLGACAEKLRQATGLREIAPEVVCAGLAGASAAAAREMARQVLEALFRPRRVYVVGDMEVALEAAVGAGPGVVLVAGTGSIAYGRNRSGRCARAGGQGPDKGDEGSGYDIGRRAVEAAQRALLEGQPRTALAGVLPQALSAEGAEGLADWLSPEKATELASLVPVVVMAARHGDEEAGTILAHAGESLAALAVEVLRELDLVGAQPRVATHGGVFAACEELLADVRARILAAAPDAVVEPLSVTPGYGAVQLAQRRWAEESTGTAR
jgi:glucosamine kinase